MTHIFIQTRFEGFHCWPDAPEPVAFLRDSHRHEFHVRVAKQVDHEERATEFILYKRAVDQIIRDIIDERGEEIAHWSCETWARQIGELAGADAVEVSEDGENGSGWTRDDEERPKDERGGV